MSNTPETDANAHNMGSVVQPHYVVDLEVAQDLERRLREAERKLCRYPDCRCPFDMGADNKCFREMK
jgi:hypothetical protein